MIRKMLSTVLVAVLMINSVIVNAAFNFITTTYDADMVELEIEAEEFIGSGFDVKNDASASGGRVLVGKGKSSGCMSYTLNLDSDVEKLQIYGIHSSSEKNQALSYISFEGFEHYSLYDYEYNKWNTTRIFFDTLSAGSYKINLKSVRAGQKIDKIIVKYNKVESKTETKETASDNAAVEDTRVFEPARPELENENISVMPEVVEGTFAGECEQATDKRGTGAIIYQDAASGGAVWASMSGRKLESSAYGDIELSYKFYVSKPDTYTLWIRYYTFRTENKDAYICIDGKNWVEVSDSVVSGVYKWKKVIAANLEKGWHTVDAKHRNSMWFLDRYVLTNNAAFTPSGMSGVPGDTSEVDNSANEYFLKMKRNPKVKSNNFRFRSDADFEFVGEDIMVPSTNIAAALGIFHHSVDDHFILTRDREYLKFYDGSTRMIASGSVIESPKPCHSLEKEDDIVMISLQAAQAAFGFDYEYDESENTVHIYDFYNEPYVRTATEDELQLETGKKALYYTIPYSNPNAKIEVWLKYDINDITAVRNMNWDNLNKLSNGGSTYQMMDQYSRHGANNWFKAQTPIYSDGAFRGVQFYGDDSSFFVKVIITDKGKQDVFMGRSKATTGWGGYMMPASEYKYNTGGELYLVPTFENISYYIDTEFDNADCEITYRKSGDKDWESVLAPRMDKGTKQFRGTIPFVKQDTEYEVQAIIKVNGKIEKKSVSRVHTWQDNPPIVKTVKLKDIYRGSGDLTILDYQGSEDGWIKIDGEGMTVDAAKDFYAAVTISNCKYLIFDNVTVRGGTEFGIAVDAKCHDVRISNCDIAEWGTGSVQDPDFGVYYRVGTTTNQRSGIQAASSVNFVVERCYIHDSDTNTNPWRNLNYTSRHPAGSTAIMMWGQRGTVIRYNDLVGSNKHRFNDVLEGATNGARGPEGSTGSDSDIYGNLLIFSNDDGMELDGAQMNVRVYQNRIERTYCGISTTPNTMGPSYLYRNVIDALNDEVDRHGNAIKIGGWKDPYPLTYMFNNMFRTSGGCIRNANHDGSTEWHGVLRNNIIAGYNAATGSYNYSRALENTYADERDDYDYDLLSGTTIIPNGSEQHAVRDIPQFVDGDAGDFRPTEESPTWKKGTTVDGFANAASPNIGPFAGDENDSIFLPARPIDISADKYVLNIKKDETATVRINIGDIEEAHTYSIVKNRDFDFIKVLNEQTEQVELKPNSYVDIQIKLEQADDGVIIFRLDNGYSVPIIVYGK